MTRAPSIGVSVSGDSIPINVERLIETRLLITANSGAGKSWALRRLLEQTHGEVQQIVIDVEDEFATLREKFDYVLAGRQGGDCPADTRCAALLARRLLELGVSAIIGIYELKAHDRVRFVRLFLESLIDAPKELWHPVMVVIDEAHMFAPENGKAESTQSVIDLATRGRKRGFCIVPATQRPAMLAKDVSAQCNNKLVGRFSQDIDVKRAADDIGFYRRDQQAALRSLKPGSFFAVGPALCDAVTEVIVGPVMTTHPRAGQRALAPPPPKENVRQVLSKLADLPAEAERDALTVADLQRKVREMEAELRKQPNITAEVSKIEANVRREYESRIAQFQKSAKAAHEAIAGIPAVIEKATEILRDEWLPLTSVPIEAVAAQPNSQPFKAPAFKGAPIANAGSADLTGPERRILDAIAWMESIGIDTPEQTAVAFLAGYTIGGGAFNNPRGALRTKGLIEYAADGIRITEQGRTLANYPTSKLTADELQQSVMRRLPGPEQRILSVLLKSYPKPIRNDECARESGYEPGGGAFNNPRGRLRTLGLIEYPQPGMLKARSLLFLENRA